MPTANYALRYPLSSASPNVPIDIKNLADDVDAALDVVDDRLDLVETGRARGCIKRARRTTASATSASTTAVPVMRLDSITLLSGRCYRITTGVLHPTSTVTTDVIRAELRFSTSGTATIASAILPGALVFEAWGNTSQIDTVYVPGSNQTMSLLLCVARESGSGNASFYADASRLIEIQVFDEGVDPGDAGVDL